MAKLRALIISLILFLFPLFFLTTTQEFYITNKFYLLGFGVLILLALATANLLIRKKLSWKKSAYDGPVIIFLILYAAAIIIVSPNKIEAIFTPVFGLITVASLTLFYFIIQQENHKGENKHNHLGILNISAAVISALTLFFFFNPFGKTELPPSLQFLKSPFFSPLGTQIDLLLFLGFFALYGGLAIYFAKKTGEKHAVPNTQIFTFVIIAIAFCLTVYNVLRPVGKVPTTANQGSQTQNISILNSLPPYSVSWFATVETLKDARTTLFGAGPGNYAALYTRVKPLQYNATPFWNVNFTQSRSALLEIWATTGLLGLGAFLFLLYSLLRSVRDSEAKFLIYYLVAAILLFPVSLPVFFLLFIMLTAVGAHLADPGKTHTMDVSSNPAIYGTIAVISFILIGGMAYFLGRSYLAEHYFKKSLDNLPSNNAQLVYGDMVRAIQLNPYIERFRLNFSQLNMLIANNAAARATQAGENKEISEQDRQLIAQTIQTAIAEAKAAVALNPNKASNWENLAVIYRNILNVAEGADQWTVASYQRAIVMDPRNPIYPLNLGGVFYSLRSYQDAGRLFEQAVGLKPDWANAHYNLAWANYQQQNYQQAVAEMEAVLTLITDKKSADYKKAQKELNEFKAKVEATGEATPSASGELNLPVPPAASIEPKLQLPEEEVRPPVSGTPTPEASPSAR